MAAIAPARSGVVSSGPDKVTAYSWAVFALSFQLSETPAFTNLVAPRPGGLWQAVLPILAFIDHLHPHVIGPDRTREATVAVLPVAFLIAGTGYALATLVVTRSHVPLRAVLGPQNVQRLISEDKVVAILGEVASKASLSGGKVAQQYGIPMISPSSTNRKVTEGRDMVSRVLLQARIVYGADPRMVRQPLSQGHGVLALLAHAQR